MLVAAITQLVRAQGASKVAVLWCDPLLNVRDIYTRTGIENILNKAKESGIGAIALGIKSNIGEVIYESNIAPPLLEWDNYRVPLGVDPVQMFLEEGRERQLQIYAVFPVFAEGNMMQQRGPLYEEHADWQTEVYVVEEGEPVIEPITEWAYGSTAFANPLHPDVQRYEIALIKEFLSKYSVDGLIFDKIQFSGIESDFSEYTKGLFIASLEQANDIQWWPEDVYELQKRDEEWQIVPGRYYKEWFEFRAKSIHQFVDKLIEEVRKLDPTLPVGISAGAWYPTYHEYGLNWASETNLLEEEWAAREYYKTAVAEMLNYVVVGCYFPRVSIEESDEAGAEWWMSIEGSAMVAMEVVNSACPVYASVLVELYKDDPNKFKEALNTAISQTNGLYLYDLSYIERHKYWEEISDVLLEARRRPLIPE